MEHTEMTEWFTGFYHIAKKKDLNLDNFNPIMQFRTYYDLHKHEHGSFSGMNNPEYYEKMTERYDFILEQINCNLEKLIEQKKKG